MKKNKAALLASVGALAAAWAALQLAPHGENLACFFTGLGFGLMVPILQRKCGQNKPEGGGVGWSRGR